MAALGWLINKKFRGGPVAVPFGIFVVAVQAGARGPSELQAGARGPDATQESVTMPAVVQPGSRGPGALEPVPRKPGQIQGGVVR